MIGERLAAARRRAGIAQVDLAVAMGKRYDSSMISQVEAGQKSTRLDGAKNAALELGVSVDYLLGLTDDPTPSARLAVELDAYRHELGELRQEDRLVAGPDADGDGGDDGFNTRHIEIHQVEASAGGGRLLDDAPITGHLAFQRTWLRRRSIDPRRATVITVSGDSMEPTLPDGCSILVDHNRYTRRKGRIFVLETDDGLIVKRAGREKADWLIISDNPYWPPATWPDDARIIGEVRWAARTF